MRVFKNTWFTRFARKENISDKELMNIVGQLEAGQADADLGGGVYKVRVARFGEGKAGGYRVIVFFRSKMRTFYVHGFAKADLVNIGRKELVKAKNQAKTLFAMTDDQIRTALKEGILEEVKGDYHE